MNLDLSARVAALVNGASTNEEGAKLLRGLAAERQCTIGALLDGVALEVAHGLDVGSVSYEEATGVMAAIHGAMLGEGTLYTAGGESYAAKVYWALDQGEYGVPGDQGLEAIASRVRPLIKRLLAEAPVDLTADSKDANPDG